MVSWVRVASSSIRDMSLRERKRGASETHTHAPTHTHTHMHQHTHTLITTRACGKGSRERGWGGGGLAKRGKEGGRKERRENVRKGWGEKVGGVRSSPHTRALARKHPQLHTHTCTHAHTHTHTCTNTHTHEHTRAHTHTHTAPLCSHVRVTNSTTHTRKLPKCKQHPCFRLSDQPPPHPPAPTHARLRRQQPTPAASPPLRPCPPRHGPKHAMFQTIPWSKACHGPTHAMVHNTAWRTRGPTRPRRRGPSGAPHTHANSPNAHSKACHGAPEGLLGHVDAGHPEVDLHLRGGRNGEGVMKRKGGV